MPAGPSDLADVSAKLREVSQKIKAERRSFKKQAHEAVHHVRCYATLKVACVILALMAPQTEAALEYIKFKRRNKEDAQAWTTTALLQHFNEFTTAEKGEMLDPSNDAWEKYFREATLWMREQGLRDWVSKQNVDKGIAPANEHVWEERTASFHDEDGGALRPDGSAQWKRRQQNQWIQRWAKRCQVQKGQFKNGERLSVGTKQAKATSGTSKATQKNSANQTGAQKW